MSEKLEPNYYNILGIERNASSSEIKKVYRELAIKYHPDKNNSDDANAKFQLINEAYNVLINNNKRHEYDVSGVKCDDIDLQRAQQIFESVFGSKSFDKIRGRDPYNIRRRDDSVLFRAEDSNLSVYINGIEITKI